MEEEESIIDLSAYDISETNGFLPTEPPARKFRDPYYQQWDDIAEHLSQLLSSHLLRQTVQTLPCLETNRLLNMSEWKRAYVVLGFMLHAYVWAEEPAEERIPLSISTPYLAVTSKLQIAPSATYACLCLWNYAPIDPSKPLTNPDNLSSLVSFTATRAEAWFYMISVSIEAQGGSLISQLIRTMQSPTRDSVLSSLTTLTKTLHTMKQTMSRTSEHLEPTTFYNIIRPWIMGFNAASARGLPNGITFAGGTDNNSKETHNTCAGGSNGQTSLLPLLDLILGITHTDPSSTGPAMREMKTYMPGRHVAFLARISALPNFRDFVRLPLPHPEEAGGDWTSAEAEKAKEVKEKKMALASAYNDAVSALTALRDRHVVLVGRFIVIPARKAAAAAAQGESDNADREDGVQGSAGTELIGFLKGMRTETEGCLLAEGIVDLMV